MEIYNWVSEYFIVTYWFVNHAHRFIDVDWHIKTCRIRIQNVKQILQSSPSGGQHYKIISIDQNVDHFATNIAAYARIIYVF